MTFAELLTNVYTITNRPDLVAETKMAIKQATLKAHHFDFFPKDLYENVLSFSNADYIQQLDYRALVPNWRALKYLRKYDAVGLTPGMELSILNVDQVFDGYALEKTDVCYLAGVNINIKSSTSEQYYIFGCYVHPSIDENTYNSWIALDAPFAIINEAARNIFKLIGFDEMSRTYDQLVTEQFAELQRNNLLANGW